MIVIDEEEIQYEDKVTFPAIPEAEYYSTMAELNDVVRKRMRKNEIGEIKSNEYAFQFVNSIDY